MTESKLAALHYCIDIRLYTPCEAMSRYENIELFEGSMEEFAATLYEIPDDLGEHDYLRRYLKIDYAQIAYDHRCNGDWNEFEFNGRRWTLVNENGSNASSGSENIHNPNEKLYDAFIERDIDELEAAISEGADLNACLISTRWHPLDFALPCGMEFVNLLLNAGADPCLMKSLDKDPFELDLSREEDSMVRNYLLSLRDSQRLLEKHGGQRRLPRNSL